MNFFDPNQLKTFLREQGFKPNEIMGQNFLIDEAILSKIINSSELKSADKVLEVGPGLGVLTKELAKRAGEVMAIEKDKKLIPILNRELKEFSNIKIIEGDILRFHLHENIKGEYKVVANIPYYLTSKLFQYFLEQENKPKFLVLMVQKEVGERVVANPGELSILGISVQIFSDAEIIAHVSKTSFWPVPEVDSVILKITPRHKYPQIDNEKEFFRIIKIAFSGKRKQVHNTLASGLKIEKEKIFELLKRAKIDPQTRPQDISIEQWISFYRLAVKFC